MWDTITKVYRINLNKSSNTKPSVVRPEGLTFGDRIARIVQGFHPNKIVLFGSYARGGATENSDIDLLIVFSEPVNKRLRAIETRRNLADMPIGKDIIVTSTEEIKKRGNLIGTILRPALREGKTLYENRTHSYKLQKLEQGAQANRIKPQTQTGEGAHYPDDCGTAAA